MKAPAYFITFWALLAACGRVDTENFPAEPAEDDRYTVMVSGPFGAPVSDAVVCLDYDAIGDYSPPKFRLGAQGKISIPHKYAERHGWEMIRVTGSVHKKRFRAVIPRGYVTWPQTVVLSEPEL